VSLVFYIQPIDTLILIIFAIRKRHVKCDEGRLECTRCLKAGMRCAGYFLDVSGRPKPGFLTTRSLLPREDVMSGLSLARPSSLLLNESEIERRYFQHF